MSHPAADPLVIEQGRLLEQLADQLEAIALRERFAAVEFLADEIREQAAALQRQPMTAEDASGRLDHLAGLADFLANQRKRQIERTFEAVPGMSNQQPDAPPDSPGTGARNARGGLNRGGTADPSMVSDQESDPNADTGGEDDQTTPGGSDDAHREFGRQGQDFPQPRSQTEEALLKSAQRSLEQSRENLMRESMAREQENDPDAQEDQSASEYSADGTPHGAMGYKQNPDWATAEDMGWERPPRANPANSGALGDAPEQAPGQAPDATAFEDTRLKGLNGDGEAQVRWVRQRLASDTREVQPDGFLPAFEHRTTMAQDKASLPRAYRSVVRSYIMILEQLGN